jgi:hypothetical protein
MASAGSPGGFSSAYRELSVQGSAVVMFGYDLRQPAGMAAAALPRILCQLDCEDHD